MERISTQGAVRTSACRVQAVVACLAVLAGKHQSSSVVGTKGEGCGLQGGGARWQSGKWHALTNAEQPRATVAGSAQHGTPLHTCAAAADWLRMKCRMDV